MLCMCFLNIYVRKLRDDSESCAHMHRQSHSSVRMTVRNRHTVNRQVQEGYAPIIWEMTKSASEEPGGVLRNRIRSNCVQPGDLRNSRQHIGFTNNAVANTFVLGGVSSFRMDHPCKKYTWCS